MFGAVPPTSTVLNAGNHSTHEKRAKRRGTFRTDYTETINKWELWETKQEKTNIYWRKLQRVALLQTSSLSFFLFSSCVFTHSHPPCGSASSSLSTSIRHCKVKNRKLFLNEPHVSLKETAREKKTFPWISKHFSPHYHLLLPPPLPRQVHLQRNETFSQSVLILPVLIQIFSFWIYLSPLSVYPPKQTSLKCLSTLAN